MRILSRPAKVFGVASVLVLLALLATSPVAPARATGTDVLVGSQFPLFNGAGDQGYPFVTFDSINDRFLVLWWEPNSPSDSRGIYGQLVNADGTLYGERITVVEHTQGQPLAAFDPGSQRFLVVYRDSFWPFSSVTFGQLVNSDGTLEGDRFHISPDLTSPPYTWPLICNDCGPIAVAFDGTLDRFLVLLHRGAGGGWGPHNLYGQFVSTGGERVGTYFPITDYTEGYGIWNWGLGYDSNAGRFLTAWVDFEPWEEKAVLGRLVNGDGSFYGGELTIWSPWEPWSGVSSISFDSVNNRFLVLDSGQMVNADGTLYGSRIPIGVPPYSPSWNQGHSAIFDTASQKYLIIGNGEDGSWPTGVFVYGLLLDADGNLSVPYFDVARGDVGAPVPASWFPPAIAFGTGETGSLVAWAATSNVEGNGTDIYAAFVKVVPAAPSDPTPPATSVVQQDPLPNAEGWNNTDVSVTFSATDDGGSGVKEVHYQVDGGKDLVAPGDTAGVTITTEGEHTITYWAVDNAGNAEPPNTLAVNIDKTPPAIAIVSPQPGDYLTSESLTASFSAEDGLSGIASISATLDGEPVSNGEVLDLAQMAGFHHLVVTATDAAGNSATEEVDFRVLVAAAVDVKPDTLNLRSKGGKNAVTAYIELPHGYDVAQVDVGSVRLEVNGRAVEAQLTPTVIGDYDSDGAPDRMVKFDRQAVIAALGESPGDITFVITGRLTDGKGFTGADTVRVLAE